MANPRASIVQTKDGLKDWQTQFVENALKSALQDPEISTSIGQNKRF